MNSKTLMERGLSEWFPLKTITLSNLPANQGIVIAIVDKELEGKPESDILYIGRTKKPSKRILGGYLGGYGGKSTKKINQKLFSEGYLEKTAIGWIQTDKPRIIQEELLIKFKEEHGDFPIWNAKKKLNVKAKKAPSPKSKVSQRIKKKAPAPKAKVTSKPPRKAKTAATKPTAKAEASVKTEMASKEQAGTESIEGEKPSGSEMTSPS
jgi:hypothetical protein